MESGGVKEKISTVLQCFCPITSNHGDLQTGLPVSIIPHHCFASTFYVFIIEA